MNIKDNLSLAFDSVKVGLSTTATVFKKGWMIFLLTTALIGTTGYLAYQKWKNTQAQNEVVKLEQEVEGLKEQSKQLIEMNEENRRVVEELKQDRELVNSMMRSFNEQVHQNNLMMRGVADKINGLEDGQVAPVLRETLREIEKIRRENK
jgi:cell division protein FtsB